MVRESYKRPALGAAWILLGCVACRSVSADGDPGAAMAAAEPVPRDPHHRHFVVPLTWDATGDSLVSPLLGDGRPFNEALPSWNVPGECAFVVDIRVGLESATGAPATFSPWLRIGDWNVAQRGEDVATAFDGGRVAVDVLELTQPGSSVQLRIAAAAGVVGGAALDPALIRCQVVLSDTSTLETRVAQAAQEAWPEPVVLDVPSRSQRLVGDDISSRICSPTSVAMVSAFHGASVPTRTMAARLLDPHFDIYGNWNRAVEGAFAFGVPGELVRVSSWDHVRAYLAQGRPVIASIRAQPGQLRGAPYEKTAGHLLVVRGLSPKGTVLVNDPAAGAIESVPRAYERADMEAVWFRRGGVAYVLGHDRSGPDRPGAESADPARKRRS